MAVIKFRFASATLLAIILAASTLHAGFITDTTIGTATRDGFINAGEYVGGFAGVNDGFGNVIGSGSTLYVDSSISGNLNFGFQRGNGGFNDNDVIVIYIDSKPGGFNSTSSLTNTSNRAEKAISGYDGNNRSIINFASGFLADYAITIESNEQAKLFSLDGNVTWQRDVEISNRWDTRVTEIGFTLANLGMTQGGTFKYIATYLNSSNAYRADEFNGVDFQGDNPGHTTVNLGASDFHSFQSVPEPTSLSLLGLTALAAMTGYRRRVR